MVQNLSTLHVNMLGKNESSKIARVVFSRCCYKLVREKFKWFGIQTRVENLIMSQEERLFRNFNRQLFCWTDQWYGLTMQDIRQMEAKAVEDLNRERAEGQAKGFTTADT